MLDPEIIPICRKGVPKDWHGLISTIEQAGLVAVKTKNSPMLINSIHRLLILHWLIKLRWNSKHKVPYATKGLKDAHKPFGEVYKGVATIIQDCHFRQFGYSRDYTHPVQWFAGILSENAIEGTFQGNKTEGIKHLQATTKKLRSYENPFDQEREPHTWKFAQTAIDSAQAHGLDIFAKEQWRPFLAARSALAKHLDNSYFLSIRCKEEEKPTISLPKTKGGRAEISLENFLFNPW